MIKLLLWYFLVFFGVYLKFLCFGRGVTGFRFFLFFVYGFFCIYFSGMFIFGVVELGCSVVFFCFFILY